MAAQVGCLGRHHHQVPGSHRDLVVAAGAEVGLFGFVGLYGPHLEVLPPAYLGNSAHATSKAMATNAAATIT